MSKESNKKKKVTEVFFPEKMRSALAEGIAFSGNLNKYYGELLEKLKTQDPGVMFIDEQWEIPQLVGIDQNQQVVMIIIRITIDENICEGEFLVSSINHASIIHITSYGREDEFYELCMDLIRGNFESCEWLSFLYSENGSYEGQLIVEKLEGSSSGPMIALSREEIVSE